MLGNCANEDDEGYVLMLMLMTLMLMMLISIPEVVVPAIDPPLALKAGRLVLKFCPALAALKVKDKYWITNFSCILICSVRCSGAASFMFHCRGILIFAVRRNFCLWLHWFLSVFD